MKSDGNYPKNLDLGNDLENLDDSTTKESVEELSSTYTAAMENRDYETAMEVATVLKSADPGLYGFIYERVKQIAIKFVMDEMETAIGILDCHTALMLLEQLKLYEPEDFDEIKERVYEFCFEDWFSIFRDALTSGEFLIAQDIASDLISIGRPQSGQMFERAEMEYINQLIDRLDKAVEMDDNCQYEGIIEVLNQLGITEYSREYWECIREEYLDIAYQDLNFYAGLDDEAAKEALRQINFYQIASVKELRKERLHELIENFNAFVAGESNAEDLTYDQYQFLLAAYRSSEHWYDYERTCEAKKFKENFDTALDRRNCNAASIYSRFLKFRQDEKWQEASEQAILLLLQNKMSTD
ncbi:hypothetical protein ACFL21_00695 [Patescibacteria group bacterium]